MLAYQAFESRVVCGHDAGCVIDYLDDFRRYRIAGHPQLHGSIINRVSAAEYFSSGVCGVDPRATFLQADGAETLIVEMEDHGFTGP